MASQSPLTSERWFPIRNINMTWDTRAGLLTTYGKDQLFAITNKNGANFSYPEFAGCFNQHRVPAPGNNPEGYGYDVSSTGGFVIVNPALDMTLQEDYYSCGSIGQFQMQVKIQCENWFEETFAANDVELVVMTMDSGVMVNQAGSTQKYIGILSKDVVLNASKSNEVYYGEDVERLVGGSILDRVKGSLGSLLSKLRPILSTGRTLLEKVDDPRAQKGAEILKSLGYGKKKKSLDQYLE